MKNNLCILLIILLTQLVPFSKAAQQTEVIDTLAIPSYELEDLVITANKKVISSDGAKLTYDVKEDESTKGQNLLDALRKVPMVTVDGQDKISINGSGNFKIYVNGKEDRMLESNYDKVFKAMPAEMVSKIEVITEPGAQYDAEGVGGILNLITEQQQRNDGYSGNIGLSYGNRQAAAYGYLNGKINKFNISANLTYADNGPMKQKNLQTSDNTYLNSDDYYKSLVSTNQSVSFNFWNAAIDMSWEPNSKNLFNWGGSFMNLDGDVDKILMQNSMYNRSGNQLWSYQETMKGKLINQGASANASYRHSFNQDNTHRFLMAYLFNYGGNKLDIDAESESIYNYSTLLPYRRSCNNTYTREHTVQADYSNPFKSGKHTLDVGLKGIFRRNLGNSYNGYGVSQDEIAINPDNSVRMNQFQDVYAAYAAYSGKFSGLTVTGGLRFEHTRMGANYKDDSHPAFESNFSDWVPNAAVAWNFSPAHNIRLAYQMRIMRPSLQQLDPFRTEFSSLEVMQGNPDLTSARNNAVSFTYTNFGRILGGNVQLSYTQTDNAIVNWQYLDGYTRVSSYGNVGHDSQTRLNGFLNINLTSKMTLALNGNLSYTDLKAKSINAHNSGWSGGYGINWNYTGPWDLKFNVSGGQSIHDVFLQGHSSGWYYYGLGIGRDFLEDKRLSVNLSAWNFMQDYQSYKSYTYTNDMYSKNVGKSQQWSVSLSISWNFGHLKEQTKKTGVNINNDDTSKADSSFGGNKAGGISM